MEHINVRIMLAARKDRDIVSSASADFLMFSGYVMMAYFWAQQAVIASENWKQATVLKRLNSIKQNQRLLLISTLTVCCHARRVMAESMDNIFTHLDFSCSRTLQL